MKINKNELKEFFQNLEFKFDYYVFGGIAVDLLRGSLTRDHGDVDLIVNIKNKESLIKFLEFRRFKINKIEKEFYRFEKKDFQLDIIFFEEKNGFVILNTKTALIKIPVYFFINEIFGNLEELKIKIVPKEFLLRTILYFDNKGDRNLLIDLLQKFNLEDIIKINYFSRRSLNDPKVKKFELRNEKLKELYGIDFLNFKRIKN